MANNRMILFCNVCAPPGQEWQYHGKGVLAIAKWYPGDGGAYYSNMPVDTWGETFFDFLNDHSHPEIPSDYYNVGAGQDNPVRLEYESVSPPKPPQAK